jgi:hypothetical protein
VRPLLAFGCFADDTDRVLAAVQRLAIVGIERCPNLGVCTAKLGATAFAYSKRRFMFNDSEFALRHEDSLTPNDCANETAPVPERVKRRAELCPLLYSCGFDRRANDSGIAQRDFDR